MPRFCLLLGFPTFVRRRLGSPMSPVVITRSQNEDADHVPNATRIAFWAETKEDVDRVADVIGSVGARNVEGPMLCPEYSPTYYALFFEDPCGNRLEVCCRLVT